MQGAIKKGWFRKRLDDRSSAPDLAALLAAAQEIAHGMAFLHSRSVIHGDLTACDTLHLRPCTSRPNPRLSLIVLLVDDKAPVAGLALTLLVYSKSPVAGLALTPMAHSIHAHMAGVTRLQLWDAQGMS